MLLYLIGKSPLIKPEPSSIPDLTGKPPRILHISGYSIKDKSSYFSKKPSESYLFIQLLRTFSAFFVR